MHPLALDHQTLMSLAAKGVIKFNHAEALPLPRAKYYYRNPHYHRDYQRKLRAARKAAGLTSYGTTPKQNNQRTNI